MATKIIPYPSGAPTRALPNTPHGKRGNAGEAGKAKSLLLGFYDVELNGVSWLWPGWLPRGRTTLLAGAGGSGKGTLASHLVACATNRKPWPDGSVSEPCLAVVVSPDDALADTLKPRLRFSGVDFEYCRRLRPDAIRTGGVNRMFHDLRQSASDDIGLVIVDMMVGAAMARGTDDNAASDVSRHLASFNILAEELNAAVVVVHHVTKWTRTKVTEGSLANLVRGSGAWTDGVRMALLITPDENDTNGSRVLVRAKCNVGGVRWSQGGYRVTSRDEQFPGDNGIPGTTTVVDDVQAMSGSAHDIFVGAVSKDRTRPPTTKRIVCQDAIERYLKPGKPILQATVVAALQAKGHSKRTIDRAIDVMANERLIIKRKVNKGEFPGANPNAGVVELV